MLIGIIGLKGSGKDTLGDLLVQHHDFVKVAYADPIKLAVCEMLGVELSDYDEFKRSPFKSTQGDICVHGRDFVVGVGMMMRNNNENQFIEYVNKCIDCNKNTVITDVRFQNEVDHIRALGGTIIEVQREGCSAAHHITEALPGTGASDVVLDNTGTIEELNNKLTEVLNEAHC